MVKLGSRLAALPIPRTDFGRWSPWGRAYAYRREYDAIVGGGTRRCIGAAFAHMEMNVVLRTLLREFTLEPTGERGERWHSRGIAYCPAKGGRAVVRRRSVRQRSLDHDHAAAAPLPDPAGDRARGAR